MKKSLLLVFTILLPVLALAQRHPEQTNAAMRESHVDEWLARIEQSNPAEYEKLMTLRKENPEAFRAELRDRLHHRQQMAHIKDWPKLQAFLTTLSPEERNNILDLISPPGEGRGFQKKPCGSDPAILSLEEEINRLAKSFHASADPAEKAQIQTDVRARLEKIFALKEQGRREMIKKAEDDLIKLREQLEKRTANRDMIIERRMGEILNPSPLAW